MKDSKDSLGPAADYRHDHPPVRNVNAEYEKIRTFGQRLADRLTSVIGSWPFMIIQSSFLLAWMAVNVYLVISYKAHHGNLTAWDPYPFILLNLVLSFQAAYTGPIVMMSQNREEQKDRLQAQNDYEINKKAELEIELITKQLMHLTSMTLDTRKQMEGLKSSAAEQPVLDKLDEVMRQIEEIRVQMTPAANVDRN